MTEWRDIVNLVLERFDLLRPTILSSERKEGESY